VSWFSRVRAPKPSTTGDEKLQLPGGLWTKCDGCSEIIYTKEIEAANRVCPKCNYHFRMTGQERLALLCDRQSFRELDVNLKSSDPLNFRDKVKYKEKIRKAEKSSNLNESVTSGQARINGREVMIGIFNFNYIAGSLGIVAGEKLTKIIEVAIEKNLPVIIVSSSGGARMQEGIYSLMQMGKVTVALGRLADKGLPYISVLADPTTGGVAASFAMLGDLNIAEPGALICFAGPRVIEQTIHKKLPPGFQRSEFLLTHGMLDFIVPRSELKDKLAQALELLGPH
jgi:acetyl-CoA carboxylase carboxyl transferase subunit beta